MLARHLEAELLHRAAELLDRHVAVAVVVPVLQGHGGGEGGVQREGRGGAWREWRMRAAACCPARSLKPGQRGRGVP